MANGYTAAIKDGITFEKFALDCARAFDACILLRDDPPGGEYIPQKFEPSNFYMNALESARRDFARVSNMTDEECEQAAAEEYENNEQYRLKKIQEIRELRIAYENMLKKVNEWKCPSPLHEGLHQFMRDQINQSIKYDCDDTDRYYSRPTNRITGEMWRLKNLKDAARNIEYYTKEHAKEVERCEKRTEWVEALRKSLKS